MILRYLILLLSIYSANVFAGNERDAQDALTKAVMKVPMVNDSRKKIENKIKSEFGYAMYFGTIFSKSFKLNHKNFLYMYETNSRKVLVQYRLEF